MDRPKPRPLSPVYEEDNDNNNNNERGRKASGINIQRVPSRDTGIQCLEKEVSSFDSETDSELESGDEESGDEEDDDDDAYPLEIGVHGINARVFLNCADADIVPVRYLEKAERSQPLKRTPWIFRAAKDGRSVNISKWSKADIRYRGVFKTLRKVPTFTGGLFDTSTASSTLNNTSASASAEGPGSIGSGRFRSGSDSGRSSRSSRYDFDEAVKAQGQVIYALLDEILGMLDLRREAEDHRSCFLVRPRLLTCQPEYWTGYRMKHRDTPLTAGSVSLDFEPSRGIPRAVLPVSSTNERNAPLKATLQGKFKLLLAQLLVNIHKLSPPGDKIPDQEAFLISIHGSRLHILRGIFPGQKTSKLWCGRHNPGNHLDDNQSTHALFARMGCSDNNPDPEGNGNASGNGNGTGTRTPTRFYTKTNLSRFIEQIEWNQLSDPLNEVHPRSFQVLGSREYDLWNKWEFHAAVKMLSGLMLYLMSGQARCGALQDVFERYPYDEGCEVDSEEEDSKDNGNGKEKGKEGENREAGEDEGSVNVRVEEMKRKAEEMARVSEREGKAGSSGSSSSSVRAKIDGLTGGLNLRQPWWDWVWEGSSSSSTGGASGSASGGDNASVGAGAGRAKDDDGDLIMGGT
ncbi:uncharacterized protein BDV14DRAFT_200032 [Aspergillus stella-maris]|uniref:uncharacterized protein n=1 Tax=Aspergillus stella-maris TaxID=1810926 RepID=UPI003CCE18BF